MGSKEDVDDLLKRASALHEIRRHREALAVLHRALAVEPDHTSVLCLIALSHFRLGDWNRTLEFADRAVAADPEEEHGHRLRSCALAEFGRGSEALRAAEEAVRIEPEEPQTLGQLANAYAACRRWDEAIDAAERMVESAPDSAHSHWRLASVYLRQERLEEAEPHLRRALAIDPEDDDALTGLGLVLCHQNRQREGMECLYRALQIAPTNTWTQQRLMAQIDRYGFSSLDEFLHAQTDPLLMEHAGRRGELKAQAQEKLDRQRAREAISPLLKALALAPEDLGLLDLLATAHTNSGDNRAAVEIADRMIRLAPDDGRGHWRRALAFYNLSARNASDRDRLGREALRSSQVAVHISPDEADYLFTLAAVQLACGLREEAEQTAQRVIAAAPNWESSYRIMARVYFDLKRWILVEVYLRRALEINPRNIGTLGTLARSLREQGKRREAAVYIKQALRQAFSPKRDE